MLHELETPQSLESEEAVLGSVLIDRDAAIRVANSLKPQDFYREKNGWIFQAMMDLTKRGTPPDFVTVCDELERHSRLEECGGREYLTSLLNAVPTSAHVRHYADIVKEMATRNDLIRVAGKIASYAYDQTMQMPDVIMQSKSSVAGIHSAALDVIPMSEHAGGYVTRQVSKSGKAAKLRTGIKEFDQVVGLSKGEMMILAGRPASGKSSASIGIALELAKEQRIPTAFCSLEMSSDRIVSRMLCRLANVTSLDIDHCFDHRRGEGPPGDPDVAARIGDVLSSLADVPLFINDRGVQTLATISDYASTVALEHNVKVLIVDHLGIVTTKGEGDNRNNEIGVLTRTLRALAKDLDLWVVVLCQLSRGIETRPQVNGRTAFKLSDLRDSGNIEQDADVVVFLDRAHVANQQRFPLVQTPLGNAEPAYWVVAKNRNGSLADVPVLFVPQQAAFISAEAAGEEEQDVAQVQD